LAQSGADLNAQSNDGETALHFACRNPPDVGFKIVEYLLDNGSDPFIKDKFGDTPFDDAENGEMHEIAALLRNRMGHN
jgi:ankyrin repeat protein